MRKKILSRNFLSSVAAVMLIAVMAAPVLASPATAARTLPSSVESGAEFDVAIEASGCGTFGQVVETLPGGFVYVSSSLPADQIEQIGNMVKFTFLGDSASFTYTARAPTVANTYTFGGVVKDADLNEFAVTGDATIIVTAPGPVAYTLTMAVNGSGSTTPPVGSHAYEPGAVVEISATPASDWRFDLWSSNVADPSSSSTTVTMDSDKTVIAYFVKVSGTRTLPPLVASGTEFDVAIEVSGCGAFGQVVETLPDGFTYVSSSLPADQVEQIDNIVKFSFFDSASFTYSVEAPRVAATITYTFQGRVLDEDRISYPIEDDEIAVTAPVVYTLMVTCEPIEGGDVTLSPTAEDNQYEAGTTVTLTANPASGYEFDHWGGDTNGTSPTTTVTMDGNKTVTAYFTEEPGESLTFADWIYDKFIA